MNKTLGIDLGTCNSAAAFQMGKDVIMVESVGSSKYGPSFFGKNFPSYVLFDGNGQKKLVGRQAKAEGFNAPKLLVWGAKRLIGLTYDTAKQRNELDRFEFDIERGQNNSILIKVGEERYTPSHILEFILREIKQDAENKNINPMIGENLNRAVVGIPAYFDTTRYVPIIEAARRAGFSEVTTIPEPTAAALNYGLKTEKKSRILTFDLGGGTLDVTIGLLLPQNGELRLGELCTSGDENLGGIDMDKAITNYLVEKYCVEKSTVPFELRRDEVERAKIRLSKKMTTNVNSESGRDMELSRQELETAIMPILERCKGPIRTALHHAELGADQLDHVLWVGGPTSMPCVRNIVIEELKELGATSELLQQLKNFEMAGFNINPMECVAKGAAIKTAEGAHIKLEAPVEPNGYGTIVGPLYFYTIIPPFSHYPIRSTVQIVFPDLESLLVTIKIVRKRVYYKSEKSVMYSHLGDFDFYIKSIGEKPLVNVTIDLDDNKEPTFIFEHVQTHEILKIHGLEHFQKEGKEIILQEELIRDEDSPSSLNSDSQNTDEKSLYEREFNQRTSQNTASHRNWTSQQLDKSISLARLIAENYSGKTRNYGVKCKESELLNIAQNAKVSETYNVLNRILELLWALLNDSTMSQEEYEKFLEELRRIERLT